MEVQWSTKYIMNLASCAMNKIRAAKKPVAKTNIDIVVIVTKID